MIHYEIISNKYEQIKSSEEWKKLENLFKSSKNIFLIGHAGNLATAEYAACNILKLSNGEKVGYAPGSSTMITLHIHDTSFDEWMKVWLKNSTLHFNTEDLEKSLVIGLSSSGTSMNVINALDLANQKGMKSACITARPLIKNPKNCVEIVLDVEYYYIAEVINHLLLYSLSDSCEYIIPKIKKVNENTSHSR